MTRDAENRTKKSLNARFTQLHMIDFRTLSCEEELPWNDGPTLLSQIATVRYNGLTGPIRFAYFLGNDVNTVLTRINFVLQFRRKQKNKLQARPGQAER